MTRYLLDSGIAAMCLDRLPPVYERAKREQAAGNIVGITSQVLSKLAARAEGSQRRERNLARIRESLDAWRLWMPTIESSFEYGRVLIELRRIGRSMGQNDMMIASIARTLRNCTVVSTDSDLFAIPGLTVVNWADDESAS